MSISSLLYPRRERSGSACATDNVRDFQVTTFTEIKPSEIAAICMDAISKLSPSFSLKNERAKRIFAPLGGSWDYSEVD